VRMEVEESARDRLFRIVESQHGVFTTKQAVDAGYERKAHTHHVNAGNWIREYRGVYRLAHYHIDEEAEYVIWSLWSRNRGEIPQGVYSHETALSLYELSDVNPAKVHMTIPSSFRRNSEIPAHIVLHKAKLADSEIEQREGYALTRPLRTIFDLSVVETISRDLVGQAIVQALERGLITQKERKSALASIVVPEWTKKMFE
jgi:predicted transcriptional regulator of viral defense system